MVDLNICLLNVFTSIPLTDAQWTKVSKLVNSNQIKFDTQNGVSYT